MGLHPTAESFVKIILARLPRAGPATLQEIYGFCEARDGGSQHFVRQAVSQLAGDCKIRRIAQGVYGALAGAEPQAEATAVDPPPEPAAAQEAADTQAATSAHDEDEDRPADTIEEPPAIAVTAEQPDTDEETDIMQTQTATRTKQRKTRNGAKNGHAATPPARTGSKVDWLVAVVKETGTARFGDIFARARKEDVFEEAKNLGAALCGAVKQKRLKKVERGVYAVPGAKVIFDAAKPKSPAPKKRTVADVKKAVELAQADKTRKAKMSKRKAASVTPAAKPGRKPSIFRSVYDELDQKLAKAKADEKAAAAGIADVDAQIENLKAKRSDFVAKRDAARATGKKLGDSRKRIAEVEAGVAASLKA